jgi:hypothetical protein
MIDKELSDKELTIHTESLFALSEDLRDHAQLESKYYTWYAEALKKVDGLVLDVEIVTAEVLNDIFKRHEDAGKPVPASGKAEVRKTELANDPRYILTKRKLNTAMEDKNVLFGLVKAWGSRSHRLTELVEIMKRQNWSDEGPYVTSQAKKADKLSEGMTY